MGGGRTQDATINGGREGRRDTETGRGETRPRREGDRGGQEGKKGKI